jgi:hypothetical protein
VQSKEGEGYVAKTELSALKDFEVESKPFDSSKALAGSKTDGVEINDQNLILSLKRAHKRRNIHPNG